MNCGENEIQIKKNHNTQFRNGNGNAHFKSKKALIISISQHTNRMQAKNYLRYKN